MDRNERNTMDQNARKRTVRREGNAEGSARANEGLGRRPSGNGAPASQTFICPRASLSMKTVRKKQFGICTKNIGKRRSDQKNNAGRNGYSDETRVGKCEETV